MSKSTAYVVIAMLVCWTAVIAAADYFVFGTTVRQYLSKSFTPTRCEIVSSEVTPHDGLLHSGVTVEYAYTVNGRDYRGWRYRYDDAYSSIAGADVVRKLRKWTEHTAYYDPKNPANSVLATGVEGGDLMLILFSIPVNVAIIILWNWIASWLREKWRVPEAGGVRIWRQNGKIRARLAGLSAPAAGFYALGGAAFAATFPLVALNGLSPSLKAMESTGVAVLAAAAAAFCWTALRNASGRYDMLIDEQSKTLTLPRTGGTEAGGYFSTRRDGGRLPPAAGEPAFQRQLSTVICPPWTIGRPGRVCGARPCPLAVGPRRRRGPSASGWPGNWAWNSRASRRKIPPVTAPMLM